MTDPPYDSDFQRDAQRRWTQQRGLDQQSGLFLPSGSRSSTSFSDAFNSRASIPYVSSSVPPSLVYPPNRQSNSSQTTYTPVYESSSTPYSRSSNVPRDPANTRTSTGTPEEIDNAVYYNSEKSRGSDSAKTPKKSKIYRRSESPMKTPNPTDFTSRSERYKERRPWKAGFSETSDSSPLGKARPINLSYRLYAEDFVRRIQKRTEILQALPEYKFMERVVGFLGHNNMNAVLRNADSFQDQKKTLLNDLKSVAKAIQYTVAKEKHRQDKIKEQEKGEDTRTKGEAPAKSSERASTVLVAPSPETMNNLTDLSSNTDAPSSDQSDLPDIDPLEDVRMPTEEELTREVQIVSRLYQLELLSYARELLARRRAIDKVGHELIDLDNVVLEPTPIYTAALDQAMLEVNQRVAQLRSAVPRDFWDDPQTSNLLANVVSKQIILASKFNNFERDVKVSEVPRLYAEMDRILDSMQFIHRGRDGRLTYSTVGTAPTTPVLNRIQQQLKAGGVCDFTPPAPAYGPLGQMLSRSDPPYVASTVFAGYPW